MQTTDVQLHRNCSILSAYYLSVDNFSNHPTGLHLFCAVQICGCTADFYSSQLSSHVLLLNWKWLPVACFIRGHPVEPIMVKKWPVFLLVIG